MTHANERLSQRVLNVDTLDIVKETSTANYTKIGEFKMTDIITCMQVLKTEQIWLLPLNNFDAVIL